LRLRRFLPREAVETAATLPAAWKGFEHYHLVAAPDGRLLFAASNDMAAAKKITICHEPQTKPKTKVVGNSALDAHLGHGDTIGPCPGDDDPGPTRTLLAVIEIAADGTATVIGERSFSMPILAKPIVTRTSVFTVVPDTSLAILHTLSLDTLIDD
jgi:hypothetical protein